MGILPLISWSYQLGKGSGDGEEKDLWDLFSGSLGVSYGLYMRTQTVYPITRSYLKEKISSNESKAKSSQSFSKQVFHFTGLCFGSSQAWRWQKTALPMLCQCCAVCAFRHLGGCGGFNKEAGWSFVAFCQYDNFSHHCRISRLLPWLGSLHSCSDLKTVIQ